MCEICGGSTRSSLGVCKKTPACSAEYYRRWRNRDIEAYRARVREGNRLRSAAWRAANPERERAKTKRWADANKDKVAARGKRWREANAERAREQSRLWREANPDKNAAKSRKRRSIKSGVPSAVAPPLEEMLLDQEFLCGICNGELGFNSDIHIDHVVPLSLGGWDVPGNLSVTHALCNISKGNRVDLNEPIYQDAIREAAIFVDTHPELVTFPAGWGEQI